MRAFLHELPLHKHTRPGRVPLLQAARFCRTAREPTALAAAPAAPDPAPPGASGERRGRDGYGYAARSDAMAEELGAAISANLIGDPSKADGRVPPDRAPNTCNTRGLSSQTHMQLACNGRRDEND